MKIIDECHGENWSLYNGDAAEVLREIPAESIDLSIYSPPFSHLYTYSSSERDLGNSRDDREFFAHYQYVAAALWEAMKPGRIACVHVQQLTTTKATHGEIAMRDFRGEMIRAMQAARWIYHGEIVIDKCPQAQAIRTKSKSLLFVQLRKDSSWLRPALADYVLLFRKRGENQTPIHPDLTNNEWIEWARPIWYNIRETHTLNVQSARVSEDERHICPLQLDTIERCIRLWSNKGETVLSPFAGLGSEVYQAVLLGRKGIGVELKPSYYASACTNLRQAERQIHTPTLFDEVAIG